MANLKLLLAAAMKAKKTWDRLPPEHRARLLEGAKTTVKTQGPIVAKKAADAARTHGPPLARRVGDAVEKARKSLQ
jgi:acyl-CoA reductase-like NAD-dependent aldehyde dehydrogenase